MTEVLKELMWIKSLLFDFGIRHTKPMTLRCDNQSAIYFTANPIFNEQTKHIESKCYFIRDRILEATISTLHVSSGDQLDYIFTKTLGQKKFNIFLYKLSIRNLYNPT